MHALLSFEYQPCWAAQLVNQYGLRIRMLSEKPRKSDLQDEAIILGKDRRSVDKALEFLPNHPHILDLAVVRRSKDGLIVMLRVNVKRQICPLYSALKLYAEEDDSPVLERVDYKGMSQWDLDTKKVEKVTEMLSSKFQVRNIHVKLRPEKREMRKSIFLLKEAYERGYFDVPKCTSLRGVAKDIGVPVSTLSIDIRRALRDIVDTATR